MKKKIEKLWFKPYTPVLFLLLILGLLVYYNIFPRFQIEIKPRQSPSKSESSKEKDASQSASVIIDKVKKLMTLPTDEEPEVISITDVNKFKDQPFFKNASNGDKILLYKINKKAIIYNPETNRLIDVAPISNASESAAQLQQYCAVLATQSAQIASQQASPTPSFASPSATLTVSPTATPASQGEPASATP